MPQISSDLTSDLTDPEIPRIFNIHLEFFQKKVLTSSFSYPPRVFPEFLIPRILNIHLEFFQNYKNIHLEFFQNF